MKNLIVTFLIILLLVFGLPASKANLISLNDFSGNEAIITFETDFNANETVLDYESSISYLRLSNGHGFSYSYEDSQLFANVTGASLGGCIYSNTPPNTKSSIWASFYPPIYRVGLLLSHNNLEPKEWVITVSGSRGRGGERGDESRKAYTVTASANSGDNGHNAVFFGVEFSTPIHWISIEDAIGTIDGRTYIDDIRFEVPEPAMLSLLGIGAFVLRKRR